jgi:hypothetical protein
MLRCEPARALVPRFFLWNGVLAWQCSLCGKLCALTLDEAEQLRPVDPPPHIREAFRFHDCQLVLGLMAERLQQSS